VLFSCSFPPQGWAQGFVENALLFSRTKPGGSARIQAMGGHRLRWEVIIVQHFLIRQDWACITDLKLPSARHLTFINQIQNASDHTGDNEATDSKTVFTVPGLSYVHHSPLDKGDFWEGRSL
jgi:hypothetical protein